MKALFVLCIGLELIAIVVFLQGFFPIKPVVKGSTTWDTIQLEPGISPGQSLPATFGRVIFVLVDALRADFVLPQTESGDLDMPHMSYVKEMLGKGEAKGFQARAQPPTVTMPRIKALMTGSIPGFVDVVLNFASGVVEEDNVIEQLYSAGRRVVFYGDDTWMRLFPASFVREEGTTSFFVTDYTEVDNNVTRHLSSELSRDDWDILILHYLGLDHIGHLAGPRSPLVKPKLQEMDDIVHRLYESISKEQRSGLPSAVVLCGDHGMSEQGSHGGATHAETATPLIIISPLWKDHTGSGLSENEVLQVDMAPSLSLLLGLPVPQTSLGVMLPSLIDSKPWRHRLQALHANSQQMVQLFQANVANAQKQPEHHMLERAWNLHASWLAAYNSSSSDLNELQAEKVTDLYREAMTTMRDKMAASLATYDLHAMAVACMLLWMVLVFFLLWSDVPSMSLLSSSSSLLCVLLLSLLFISFHVVMCTSSVASTTLCTGFPFYSSMAGCVLVASMVTMMFSVRSAAHSRNIRQFIPCGMFGKFLLVGTLGHTLSLCASSFVEEEHQTWYFLSLTAILLLSPYIVMDYYGSARNNQSNARTIGPVENSRATLIHLLVLLILNRVLRGWNRTGDKWASLPDTGDWLILPDNKALLSVVAGVSLLVIWLLQAKETSITYRLCTGATLTAIYAFRAATGVFVWPIEREVNKGITEARLVFTFLALIIVYTVFHKASNKKSTLSEDNDYKHKKIDRRKHATQSENNKHYMEVDKTETKSINCHNNSLKESTVDCSMIDTAENVYYIWALLMTLLVRPHNIPVVAMEMGQVACLQPLVRIFLHKESSSIVSLFYIWMGQAAFFHQGNSNSIASVDVSSGYIGLEDYQPVLIGLLMALHTYSGPILWILARTKLYSVPGRSSSRQSMSSIVLPYLLSRSLVLAVYTVLVSLQRYHLFVWTVFSPKLLYEGMHTLIISILCSAIIFMERKEKKSH